MPHSCYDHAEQLDCGCWAEDGHVISANPYCKTDHSQDDDDDSGA